MRVFVVDKNNKPLMPTTPARARKWIKSGKATPFYKKGLFCVRLNQEQTANHKQPCSIAIDPGSKRTGITIATENSVVTNLQCNTPDWVKGKVETRRNYRRSRRGRNTPYRKCRFGRKIGGVPPSTKARWQAHLRIIDIASKILPLTDVIIEDIKTQSKKGQRKWNSNFTPLQIGKAWFESEIRNRKFSLWKIAGYETSEWRRACGYSKTSAKLSEVWEAHCVDSHSITELVYGPMPVCKRLQVLTFLRFNRRELHKGFKKGGLRRFYGSTRSMGLNRGSLVKHPKYGLAYVGGSSKGSISLHNLNNGKRLSQSVKVFDCKILTNGGWCISSPH